jgi:hypothetical protein
MHDCNAQMADDMYHNECHMTHLIEATKVALITKQYISLQAVLIVGIDASTDA